MGQPDDPGWQSSAELRAVFARMPSELLMQLVITTRQFVGSVRLLRDIGGRVPPRCTDEWLEYLTLKADVAEDVLLERMDGDLRS